MPLFRGQTLVVVGGARAAVEQSEGTTHREGEGSRLATR